MVLDSLIIELNVPRLRKGSGFGELNHTLFKETNKSFSGLQTNEVS
jgi:hypothetical protein